MALGFGVATGKISPGDIYYQSNTDGIGEATSMKALISTVDKGV